MKDIFSPIFFSGLLFLGLLHGLNLHHEVLAALLWPVFIGALLLYFLKKFNGAYILLVLSFIFLLGYHFLLHKDHFMIKSDFSLPMDRYISIRGYLREYPVIQNEHSVIYIRSRVLEFERKQITAVLNIRIKVRGDLKSLFRGDEVIVQAKIFQNRYHENFENSPFRNYNLYKTIHFNGYSKSSQLVKRVSETGLIWKVIGKWRNRLRHVVEEKWLDSSGNLDRRGVFLEAVLLGERGRMTASQKESLLSSGIFHLFAISGAHIGIIAFLFFLLFKWMRFRLKPRIVATILILIVFLALSGFKVSAQRAVIMAVIILLGQMLQYRARPIGVISFAGLIILFVNPAEILDPGFILTFALTLSIVLGRKFICGFFQFIPGYIREFMSANLSASLISLPLSLYFFKRYSLAGFFAGLVLLPLTAVIIGFGLVSLLLAPLWPAAASGVLQVNSIPLGLFFQGVDFFSDTVRLNIFRASPALPWVVLVVVLFWILGFRNRFRGQNLLVFIGFLICLIWMGLPSPRYRPRELEVHYFDVGQGDSSLVVFPTGQSLLIDGGGSYYSDFEVGKNLVLPFILQKRIKVSWMAVSHFHPDHCRGVTEMIGILRPDELWISSEARKNPCFRRLIAYSELEEIKIRRLRAPFGKQVGNCSIRFLSPTSFRVYDHTHNDHSQVVRISSPFHSFLFTGDIEKGEELNLAEKSCAGLASTAIKIPHHGSRSSSSAEFIRCVNPRIALFSYAQGNRFRFPHPMVLERLKRMQVRWLSTANRGGIRLRSSKKGLEIETTK